MLSAFGSLWVVLTIIAAFVQTLRNAMQREMTQRLGTVGATHIRFLFGLPFGCLFLLVAQLATGAEIPVPGTVALVWMVIGSFGQIFGTALLLEAMENDTFVVSIAYAKTEPIQVALFGLLFLGDELSLTLSAAILMAVLGVTMLALPSNIRETGAKGGWLRPAALGIGAGSCFAFGAIGFRGGIQALDTDNFVMAATTAVAIGLFIQAGILGVWLAVRSPDTVRQIIREWRPSLAAGLFGALASQFWYLAFALESAAKVRTLALVELLFAHILSRSLFRQRLSLRSTFGLVFVAVGVILLVNA